MLAAIYYLLFTPLAVAFRLTGRDELALRRQPEAASYWVPKRGARGVADYLRQS